MPFLTAWARPLMLSFVGFVTGPVYVEAVQIARGGMQHKRLMSAIDGMLKPLGLGLLLLAAVA